MLAFAVVWALSTIWSKTNAFCSIDIKGRSSFLSDDPNVTGDAVFMVHNSRSIGIKNWALLQASLRDLADSMLATYPRYHSIGILSFHRAAQVERWMLSNKYEHIKFNGSLSTSTGTNIASALKLMLNGMFNKEVANGGNVNSNNKFGPNTAILVTTGPPDNVTASLVESQRIRRARIPVIVIALGNMDLNALKTIAENKKSLITGSFDNLNKTFADVKNALSSASVLLAFDFCYQMDLDLLILFDLDENVLGSGLSAVKHFLKYVDLDHTNIALLTASSPPKVWNYLKSGQSVDWVNRKLSTIIMTKRRSSFRHALRTVRQHVFDESNGDRPGSHNLVMVITDRKVTNDSDSAVEAKRLHAAGIHVVALGVDQRSKRWLQDIVSDQRGLVVVDTHSELPQGLQQLHYKLCPETCDRYGSLYKGRCYYYHNEPRNETWLQVQTFCAKYKYTLPTITNADEDDYIRRFYSKGKVVYLGLRKYGYGQEPVKVRFEWATGRPLIYSNWARNGTSIQPDGSRNELCTLLDSDGWYDVGCATVLQASSLCEYEARPAKLIIPAPKLPILGQNANRVSLHTSQCGNGELVSIHSWCDGHQDCRDGTDEIYCDMSDKGCSQEQFPCRNGKCISASLYCDHWDDCGDNSDEQDCIFPTCASDEFPCDNGKCIPGKYVCDLFNDCNDWSDENNCIEKGACRQVQCYDGTCIPFHWVQDGVADCPGKQKEDESVFKRKPLCNMRGDTPLFKWLNDTLDHCRRVPDGYGKYLPTTLSSEICETSSCASDEFRCSNGFCVFAEDVCNGIQDCADGEDENNCDDYVCPSYFRCRHSHVCLSPAKICDGYPQCPEEDDERLCDFRCPEKAACTGAAVTLATLNVEELSQDTRILTFKRLMTLNNIEFPLLPVLMALNMSRCGLDHIPDLLTKSDNLLQVDLSGNKLANLPDNALRSLRRLTYLNLSGNMIEVLNPTCFRGLVRLKTLDLSRSRIRSIMPGSFRHLKSLSSLDLGRNRIFSVQDMTFHGLAGLRNLDLRGNSLTEFKGKVFQGLTGLSSVSVDNFLLCCPKVLPSSLNQTKCFAPLSSLSSCRDLMQLTILRIFLWVLGVMALFGNSVVIVYRIITGRRSNKNACDLFIANLGVSDLLMGMYMMIIASADHRYRDIYIWHDYEWRRSVLCKTAGFLSALSSEASVMFVCMITLDRFLVMRFPFRQIRLGKKLSITLCVVVWILAFIFASIPFLPSLWSWNFYGQNGACLALPLGAERLPGWRYSISIFVAFNFVTFAVIAVGQCSIYKAMKSGSVVANKERKERDLQIAKKLLLVVMTDFICWFPVCIMGILAACGVTIEGEVYAWTAVFVLPVNSALNPVLYTLPLLKRKTATKRQSTGLDILSRQAYISSQHK